MLFLHLNRNSCQSSRLSITSQLSPLNYGRNSPYVRLITTITLLKVRFGGSCITSIRPNEYIFRGVTKIETPLIFSWKYWNSFESSEWFFVCQTIELIVRTIFSICHLKPWLSPDFCPSSDRISITVPFYFC